MFRFRSKAVLRPAYHFARRSRLRFRSAYDRRTLERDFPFLSDTGVKSEVEETLRQPYGQYITEVSSPIHAASFEASVFLALLCRGLQPARVLDLGSGFSSFVFRHTLPDAHEVLSMDDDAAWLERTRQFLVQHGAGVNGLEEWNPIALESPNGFDMVFYDLGSMNTRAEYLERVVDACRRWQATLVIDDAHQRLFRRKLNRELRGVECQVYVTWPFTRDSYDRYSLVLHGWPD